MQLDPRILDKLNEHFNEKLNGSKRLRPSMGLSVKADQSRAPMHGAAKTFVRDDGGRAKAGFTPADVADSLCRSLAIVTRRDYAEVHQEINAWARDQGIRRRSPAEGGLYIEEHKEFLKQSGLVWVPTMQIGKGCEIHLRKEELPRGRLVVRISKRWTAAVNGMVHDTHDPSREGTRCVYGYYKLPA